MKMGSEVNNMIKVFCEENDCIFNPWAEIDPQVEASNFFIGRERSFW
jgi:hypothetical protein